MYTLALLLAAPVAFGLLLAIPTAIYEGLKKLFTEPNDKLERKYLSSRLHHEWN